MLRALSLASGSQPVGRMPNRERHARGFPRLGRRHRADRDAARSDSLEQIDGRRIGRPAETGRDVHDSDREAIEQVEQAVVMILIGMAQEDGVDPAHSARPKRRRNDPAADARVAQPPAVVQARRDRPGSGSAPPGHDRPTGIRPQAVAARDAKLDREAASPGRPRPGAATRAEREARPGD